MSYPMNVKYYERSFIYEQTIYISRKGSLNLCIYYLYQILLKKSKFNISDTMMIRFHSLKEASSTVCNCVGNSGLI